MLNVYKALLTARKQFEAVKKKGDNPHFKSKFARLEDVFAATDEALHANGLMLVQTVQCDGARTWLETRLVHAESGEDIRSEYPLQPGKTNDPQALGGALTYARRYAALAILGIAPEADDGQPATHGNPREQRRAISATSKDVTQAAQQPARESMLADMPTMLSAVKEKMKACGMDSFQPILDQFKFAKAKEIPVSAYKPIMDWLDTLGTPIQAEPEKTKKGKK